MKKLASLFCALALIVTVLCVPVGAVDKNKEIQLNDNETLVEVFEDGSYITTSEATLPSTRSGDIVNHTKNRNFYDSRGVREWVLTVYGTFEYDGNSATCIGASCDYQILTSGWKVTSASAYASGNQAIGNFVVKKTLIGITVDTRNETVTLTCSPNGDRS